VYDALDDQVSTNEHLSIQWQDYEKEYEACRMWMENKDTEVSGLIVEDAQTENALDHLKVSLQLHFKLVCIMLIAQDLKHDLEKFAPKLTNLSQLSDQLTPNMDNATIIHITARETALQQKLSSLQQALNRHQKSLQEGLDQHKRFSLAFNNVDQFLSQAEVILRKADPTASADEADIRERLEQFKALSDQFTERLADLETVNLIGYRLPLSETDSHRMRHLNQKWYQLSAETSDRYKHMQNHLLLQQDFSQKCEEWMLFLAQIEKDLASDIAGNYEALLEQQQAYEVSLRLLANLLLTVFVAGFPPEPPHPSTDSALHHR
jgi:nesprin-1